MALVVMAGLLLFTTSHITNPNLLPNLSVKKADSIRIMNYNMRIAHPPSKGWSELGLSPSYRRRHNCRCHPRPDCELFYFGKVELRKGI